MILVIEFPIVSINGVPFDRNSPETFISLLKDIAKNRDYARLNRLCTSDSQEIAQSICGIGESSEELRALFSQTYSTLSPNGLVIEKGDFAFVPFVGIDEVGKAQEAIFLLKKKHHVWYFYDVCFDLDIMSLLG